jgi:hypothetical protein
MLKRHFIFIMLWSFAFWASGMARLEHELVFHAGDVHGSHDHDKSSDEKTNHSKHDCAQCLLIKSLAAPVCTNFNSEAVFSAVGTSTAIPQSLCTIQPFLILASPRAPPAIG